MARASIRQVAEHAGVSAMTVSRVLRGSDGVVSAKTRERILAAVRELDYVPVRSAMQNRHVRTGVIGLVFDQIFSMKSVVGANTFDGLREAAFAYDYDLLLLRSRPESSFEQQKQQFLDRRSDGFVFVTPRQREEVLECLVRQGFPAVSCYSVDVPDGVAWIVPDNATAIRQAVQMLMEAGHKDIGFIAARPSHSDSRHRCEAYVQSMKMAGLMPFWMESHSMQDVKQAAETMLERKVTAVICHSDGFAMLLWNMAEQRGLQIPRDLSIIGVDDTPEAAARGLTTFVNPFQEIGRTAVESLIGLLQGGDVRDHCHALPMKLVVRNSVSGPRPI
jgi:DNA-binding LacI/PurR family transcriptional regulator